VYLRRPAQSDFEELQARFAESTAHLRGYATVQFDRERFEQILAASKLDSNECFLICRNSDDAIVGQINLSQIFRKAFQNAYLGYQLFNGFTGHGYMTQAVEMVLEFAFEKLKLHRIEANVQPDNHPSIAVLRRTGFSKEGFSKRYLKIGGKWRDHERWAIVTEDWRSKKQDDSSGSKK
jgi:ribosomal-protein-alanine N-acetyltransferase